MPGFNPTPLATLPISDKVDELQRTLTWILKLYDGTQVFIHTSIDWDAERLPKKLLSFSGGPRLNEKEKEFLQEAAYRLGWLEHDLESKFKQIEELKKSNKRMYDELCKYAEIEHPKESHLGMGPYPCSRCTPWGG